jgi:hypothetical protein
MQDQDLLFVIRTSRLGDVGEKVEHFWRNGHSVLMIVLDDSSPANQEKYYPLLEQTRSHDELNYVGPREKEQFIGCLNGRLRMRGGHGPRPRTAGPDAVAGSRPAQSLSSDRPCPGCCAEHAVTRPVSKTGGSPWYSRRLPGGCPSHSQWA